MTSQTSNSGNTYTVQIISEDGDFLFQSDVFYTKSDAKSLIEYMTSDGTQLSYLVYKNKPQASTFTTHIVGSDSQYDMESDLDFDESEPLSGMIIEKHGQGYILIPPIDDPRCGEKYFYEGWWKPSLNAWFFKHEHLQNLYELGAEPQFEYSAGQDVSSNYSSEADDQELDNEDNESFYDLTGMVVRAHGKGFLLIPYHDYELFGEKYFMNGWWMPKFNAWFFKAEFYDDLLQLGAVEEVASSSKTSSKSSRKHKTSPSQTQLSNMALTSYGKGYLLTTHSSDANYGKYYYYDTHGFTDTEMDEGTFTHVGFWNSKAKGWFFRKSSLQYLTDVACAKFIKDEPSDSFVMSDDLSNMSLTHYGKGYLLCPCKSDSRFGEKYYHLPDGGQGWWRQDLSGWFFKSQYFEELVDMGAKYSEKSSQKTSMRASRNGTRSS